MKKKVWIFLTAIACGMSSFAVAGDNESTEQTITVDVATTTTTSEEKKSEETTVATTDAPATPETTEISK